MCGSVETLWHVKDLAVGNIDIPDSLSVRELAKRADDQRVP